jgi:DNA repair protein RecO (recombination protein O)
MRQLVTKGIILSRTDYGEADRIITLLTPDYGKLTLLAKGVRRVKSKLAGGIELFSVSEITFIKGRGDVGTLVSTRLLKHFEKIVSQLDRTMTGYNIIKQLHKATEDQTEEDYFDLLAEAFEALNDLEIPLPLISFWFMSRLIWLSGHEPNLQTDSQGRALQADGHYGFSFDDMAFGLSPEHGRFNASHIKFLRLVMNGNSPKVLAQVQGSAQLVEDCTPLIQTVLQTFVRV